MKLLLIIGGALGFGIGLVFSWLQQTSWPTSLLHASLAAYAASWLLIWWGKTWQKNLQQAWMEKESQPAPAPVRATASKPTRA
jgi:hypothetical protein